jgi:SAM-dependent methyltransferase
MQPVNYDAISTIYDDVRRADLELIQEFIGQIEITPSTRILDLGCGTGNYLDLFQRVTQAQFYGVEPSIGMGLKASHKNNLVSICTGDAYHIPYVDDCFDFIYMTDVIHHIQDYHHLFAELHRVVKPAGRACIVTQSHDQIEKRPIVQFFPETIIVDQARYPKIDEIIQSAFLFVALGADQIQEQSPITLGSDFLELVRKKGYSMLHLISDDAYALGLGQLETSLQLGDIDTTQAGSTLVWLQKR